MTERNVPGVLWPGAIAVGDEAPDFELPALIAGAKKRFRLSACRGQQSVVLAFYPFNWQAASAEQMKNYQAERPRLLAAETEVVGITVDSIMNTTTWEREIGPLDFVLCSDFWPHGEVCSRYGVLREHEPWAGACERAIVVVDRVGRVVFRKVYEWEEVPPLGEIFPVLGTL
jgi:peroxiredoxin